MKIKIFYLLNIVLIFSSCMTIGNEDENDTENKTNTTKIEEITYLDYYELAVKEENLDEKIILLNSSIGLKEDYIDSLYLRGYTYYKLLDLDSAIEDLNRVYDLNSEYDNLNNLLGVSYARKGDYNNALIFFLNESRISEHDAYLLDNIAHTYKLIDDFENAIVYSSKAIDIKETDKYLYTHRSSIYFDNSKYLNAIDDIDVALQLDPNFGDAFYLRALCNLFLGEYESSLNDLDQALLNDVKKDYVLFFTAYNQYKLENYHDAIIRLQSSIIEKNNYFQNREYSKFEYNEGLVNINVLLSLCYQNLDEIKLSNDHIRKIIGIDNKYQKSASLILDNGKWRNEEIEKFTDIYEKYIEEL